MLHDEFQYVPDSSQFEQDLNTLNNEKELIKQRIISKKIYKNKNEKTLRYTY